MHTHNIDDERRNFTYSWHQSHDQATILLIVPYESSAEDVFVIIEQNYLIAGVRGHPAVVKGQLYGSVNTSSSVWQLEPRMSRGRTISTTSTMSTRSSFAFVSDQEISSSFAASLESGHTSEAEEFAASPAISSRNSHTNNTPDLNPLRNSPLTTSSYSSVDSLHAEQSSRLLTLHLEKQKQSIWPTLIVGPVPEIISPVISSPSQLEMEHEKRYNMDATSLNFLAEDLFNTQRKEEAFEYFVRAWHQAHSPLLTLRILSYYLPLHSIIMDSSGLINPDKTNHYIQRIGGQRQLARLFLDAGFLHLDGSAERLKLLLSSKSIKSTEVQADLTLGQEDNTSRWDEDRIMAQRYFSSAKNLCPDLETPVLPSGFERQADNRNHDIIAGVLQLPALDSQVELRPTELEPETTSPESGGQLRLRRRKEAAASTSSNEESEVIVEDRDNTWYLYIPGLIGAGTALLIVGVVSALSFSSWRKNQS